MIGDALWYPLWVESKVESTCKSIVQLSDGDARLGGGGVVSSQPSPSPARQTQQMPDADNKLHREESYNQCWNMLNTTQKVIDAGEVRVVLEELGLTDATDLAYCEEEQLHRLARLLKPVPQKKFMALILEQSKV